MRAKQQSVVITTHSMEEADAVCNRLAIQVNGVLRCLGSPLHLKSKYGSGYQVEVFLNAGGTDPAAERNLTNFFLQNMSNDVRLLEKQGTRFLYQLPLLQSGKLTLGRIFTSLQAARRDLGIQDYGVTQPTLEQVFLRFAKEQASSETAEP